MTSELYKCAGIELCFRNMLLSRMWDLTEGPLYFFHDVFTIENFIFP